MLAFQTMVLFIIQADFAFQAGTFSRSSFFFFIQHFTQNNVEVTKIETEDK